MITVFYENRTGKRVCIIDGESLDVPYALVIKHGNKLPSNLKQAIIDYNKGKQ